MPGLTNTCLLLLGVFCAPFLHAQEVRLSYDLSAGREYALHIEIQQSTSSEASNNAEISISSQVRLRFRVDSMDSGGRYHMRARYEQLQFSMLAPGLGVDMNSSNGRSRNLSTLMDSLQQRDFKLTMLESGELIQLNGLEDIFSELASYPTRDSLERILVLESLDQAYGPRAFRGLFQLFVSYFPAVQPIKNWTHDLTYYFNTKPVKMVNRYYHARSTSESHTIQGMGMLNSLEPYEEFVDLGRVESYLSGTQTYDYQVDPASGWLLRCVSRQRVMVEATILESNVLPSGLKIPSYTETVFEVKGIIEP